MGTEHGKPGGVASCECGQLCDVVRYGCLTAAWLQIKSCGL